MDTNIALEIAKAIQDSKAVTSASDSAANQTTVMIVSSIVGLIGTMFTGVMAYFMAKVKAQNDKSAVAVQTVADTLSSTTSLADEKLNAIAKVADATHKLTNSNMGVQLRLTSSMAQRVADLTKSPEDILKAVEAERASIEHQAQQNIVDTKYPDGIPNAGV